MSESTPTPPATEATPPGPEPVPAAPAAPGLPALEPVPSDPGGAQLARALAFATFVVLFATQAPVGFTRDEGYYFAAASSYEEWLLLLFHSPLQAASAGATERFWSVNWEHPPLAKLLFAASHLVFTRWLGLLPDAAAWRLPGAAFGGLLTLWLAQLGFARSRAAGVLAPLLFWCTARTFFHGHLACFDIPICALTAGVGVTWARGLGLLPGTAARSDGSGGGRGARMGPGLTFGLTYAFALATKHNAWFLPPVLLLHGLLCPALRARALRLLRWVLVAPVLLVAVWPLLWHDGLRHLGDWIAFHLHHVHYSWWFLGDLLRQPPFPAHYPLTLLALTLPVTTVALLAAAGARLLAAFVRRSISPLQLLELGLASAGLLPFLLTTTPIFGGIKHWLAFPALLAPEAAALLVAAALGAAAAFPRLGERRALSIAAAAALLPGLWQIAHLHPYGTSAYGELAGGASGAASLGMQRQYWSGNVVAVLPWLNSHAPPGSRIFFQEVNFESFRAYQQAGLLRRDLNYAGGPGDADYAALQWHREFRDREPETWNAWRTQRPATGLFLDETPQVLVYARPGLPGAP